MPTLTKQSPNVLTEPIQKLGPTSTRVAFGSVIIGSPIGREEVGPSFWEGRPNVPVPSVPTAEERLGTRPVQCLRACPDCPELSRVKIGGVGVQTSSLE